MGLWEILIQILIANWKNQKKGVFDEDLTQGVECGDVLPHVAGLVGTRLPHQSVHVMSEAETRHIGRVHVNREQVLMAAQIDLQEKGVGVNYSWFIS